MTAEHESNLDAALHGAVQELQQVGCELAWLTFAGQHVSPLAHRLLRIASDAVAGLQALRATPVQDDATDTPLCVRELGRTVDAADVEAATDLDLRSIPPRRREQPW